MLEIPAAALAAERATDYDRTMLAGALAGLSTAKQVAQRKTAEAELHRAIAAATGNRPLIQMLAPAHHAIELTPRAAHPETVTHHRAIVDAINAGHADAAAAAMRAHLDALEDHHQMVPGPAAR